MLSNFLLDASFGSW